MPANMPAAADRHQSVSSIAAVLDCVGRWRSPPDKQLFRARIARLAVLITFMAAALLQTGNARAFHREASSEPHRPRSLAEVVAFVQAHGRPVNLGYLCKGLSVAKPTDECLFRQIAVHTKTAQLNDHGFNILSDEPLPSHILLYHVTPLAGEFFLATIDGELITAVFRARGTDFEPMLGERGRSVFKSELVFWQNNFTEIERGFLTGNRTAAPISEQRR